MFKLTGTLIGERRVKYKEFMIVVDKKNDLIASINMEHDDRGLMKRLFSKRNTYPDYFRYFKYLK